VSAGRPALTLTREYDNLSIWLILRSTHERAEFSNVVAKARAKHDLSKALSRALRQDALLVCGGAQWMLQGRWAAGAHS